MILLYFKPSSQIYEILTQKVNFNYNSSYYVLLFKSQTTIQKIITFFISTEKF